MERGRFERKDGDEVKEAPKKPEAVHGCEVLDHTSGVGSTCGILPVQEKRIGRKKRRVCSEHANVEPDAF